MIYVKRNNELMHYGRKGMKWGKHIYGDELNDTTNLNKKHQPYGSKPKDYVIKKGQTYYRMAKNVDEGSSSLYVSKDPARYTTFGKYLKSYTLTDDAIIAGYKSIAKIYGKIQNVKIKDLDKWYKGGDWEDALRGDTELRTKFFDEAKRRGYAGVVDPNNSGIQTGYDNKGRNSAIIFINDSNLRNDYVYDTKRKEFVKKK